MIESLGATLPNHKVEWTVLIVTYPFLSGILAGYTIISALVYLFGLKNLQQVERVGHFMALALLFTAPLAPMFDLTVPIRSLLVPFYANFSSPITLFFVLWTILLIVLLLKTYYMLKSPDESKVRLWAIVSVPVALAFTSYVGFLMSAMHAVPLWGTSTLILLFLISAIVSGIGATLLLYVIAQKFVGESVDPQSLKIPMLVMSAFACIELLVLFIKYVSEWYWNTAHWPLVAMALKANTLVLLIEILGLLFVFVGGLSSLRNSVSGITLLSVVSLIAIYAARWMMVIPPQMIDKGGRGIVYPHVKFIGREGVNEVIALFFLAAFLFILFISLAGYKPAQQQKEVA